MLSKTNLLIGFAAGYVLGSRAGRERYDQIVTGAQRFARNPKVQDAAGRAQEAVGQQAPSAFDAAKDKVTSSS
ncbi:MAG: hypothetical protein H6529_00570 [Nocardioides sp.]|nr:hypothetical protein [Nocardioides sp.]